MLERIICCTLFYLTLIAGTSCSVRISYFIGGCLTEGLHEQTGPKLAKKLERRKHELSSLHEIPPGVDLSRLRLEH